jgi:hypothetical protein
MTRLLIILILAAAFIVGFAAGRADAAVYFNGHRVRVAQVGAIDASPCPDPEGCLRAVVELRFRSHHANHLVRCGHPRRLHVYQTFRWQGDRWADVFACSRHYAWRLPR